ncbi:hypothetical protein ACVV2G_32620 [Streptomyces ziwulingensis]
MGQFQYPTPPLAHGRDGIHELLDIETARATADTLTNLHDDLTRGVGISSPAAQRAIHAAAQAPTFAGSIRTQRQAHDILRNPALTVYDNPNAFLMCVYNRDRAPCHRLDLTEARAWTVANRPVRTSRGPTSTPSSCASTHRPWTSRPLPRPCLAPSLTGSPDAPDTCAGWRTGTDETALTYRSRRHEPSPG